MSRRPIPSRTSLSAEAVSGKPLAGLANMPGGMLLTSEPSVSHETPVRLRSPLLPDGVVMEATEVGVQTDLNRTYGRSPGPGARGHAACSTRHTSRTYQHSASRTEYRQRRPNFSLMRAVSPNCPASRIRLPVQQREPRGLSGRRYRTEHTD